MAELAGSIKILLNSLKNLPTFKYFELIVECVDINFGRISKLCPDEDGSVMLKFPVNVDIMKIGLQQIINNFIIISLHQTHESTGRRKNMSKLLGKFALDAFQVISDYITNKFIVFKDLCLELDTCQNIQLELSIMFEPNEGKTARSRYNCARIRIEHLLSMPDIVIQNYRIIAAFRNYFSKDKEVVLCDNSKAVKVEKLVTNDSCMAKRNDENLQIKEETFGEKQVQSLEPLSTMKWNKEWRQVLTSEDFDNLKETISFCPMLSVEVFGYPLRNEPPCLSSLNDSHGVAFVDLSQLLYPGVTRVRGSCKVKPFDDEIYAQMATKGPSVTGEVVGILRALNQSAKKDKGASTLKKETAKSSTVGSIPLESINFDHNNFCLSVDIQLSKPLVSQRRKESVVLDVKDVLKGLEPALTESIDIQNCIHLLKNGITKMFSNAFYHARPPFERLSVTTKTSGQFEFAPEERALEDVYLNFQSHLHFPFAADVKKCLSEITEPSLQNCIQDFLDDLKVYLIKESRQLLHSIVEGEDEPEHGASIGGLNHADLLYFAEEAEALGYLSWAHFFIRNALAVKPRSEEALVAASSFYIQAGNREEAVVCLRRCLETTPNNVEVLCNLGILLAEMSKFDEARRLLEAAFEIGPNDPTQWIVLGLFNELACNTWNFEHTNIDFEATKLDDKEDEGVMYKYTNCTNLIITIDRLLELKASSFVDRALARLILHIKHYRSTLGDAVVENDFQLPERIARSSKCYRDYMCDLSAFHRLSALYIMQSSTEKGKLLQAETHLNAALQTQPECADNWACLGRLHCLQVKRERAIECFERAMQLETWPIKMSRHIQLQLAQCYAGIKDFEKSKLQYLQCCKQYSTPESWKGVGVACFRLNRLEEAEVAFQESNRLNNRDPVVWAYLAMLCLKTGKRLQAEICLQSVQMLDLADEFIRKELDQVMSNTESFSNDEKL